MANHVSGTAFESTHRAIEVVDRICIVNIKMFISAYEYS
jgi:hypothetical protein